MKDKTLLLITKVSFISFIVIWVIGAILANIEPIPESIQGWIAQYLSECVLLPLLAVSGVSFVYWLRRQQFKEWEDNK